MRREYRGESADEWLHITCPEDCASLESAAGLNADYNAALDPNWTPTITLPPLYWARVDGQLQQVTAEQYAAIYKREKS